MLTSARAAEVNEQRRVFRGKNDLFCPNPSSSQLVIKYKGFVI